MTEIDRLAREICWIGFSPAGRRGKTKAGYWKLITELARERYRADARQFLYVLHGISEPTFELAISMKAHP